MRSQLQPAFASSKHTGTATSLPTDDLREQRSPMRLPESAKLNVHRNPIARSMRRARPNSAAPSTLGPAFHLQLGAAVVTDRQQLKQTLSNALA